MYQDFYRGSELLNLPLFTLVLFVTVFLAVVTWLFIVRRGDKRFDEMARLPLASERVGVQRDE